MLLIRPLLRANAGRRHRAHVVVFFIFLVSNVGGALTPLGDPPLFLGFLHGVPFFWTLRLLPHDLCVTAILLGVLFVSTRACCGAKSAAEHAAAPAALSIEGAHNLIFLPASSARCCYPALAHARLRCSACRSNTENLVRDC